MTKKQFQAKNEKIHHIAKTIRRGEGIAWAECYGVARMIVNGETPGVSVGVDEQEPAPWWHPTLFREEAPR